MIAGKEKQGHCYGRYGGDEKCRQCTVRKWCREESEVGGVMFVENERRERPMLAFYAGLQGVVK